MTLLQDLAVSNLDLAAFAWFLIAGLGYRQALRVPAIERHSVTGAVQQHRVSWMQNMSARGEHRVLDTILLNGLGQGNAFFASTSAIAVGGLAALLGSGEKAQAVLEKLPFVALSSAAFFEIKILMLIGIFVYAFFKFAWAFRLSHYTAIMIGSTPLLNEQPQEVCDLHALRTARLVGIAAEHANAGMRSFYYAVAVMAWFVHPIAFFAATTWVLCILIRREYFSRSRDVLDGRWPKA